MPSVIDIRTSQAHKLHRNTHIRGNLCESGFNKTDTDASTMMMKNKVEILPAYNVMA